MEVHGAVAAFFPVAKTAVTEEKETRVLNKAFRVDDSFLERGDAAKLYEFEGLWAPFWCPACAAVYCIAHWTVVPEYDEGFFDCSQGFCPKGHKRLIED